MTLDRLVRADILSPSQAECDYKSQWFRNWYAADWAYALPVVYFFCASIIVFSLMNWIMLRRNKVG
jgi:hypothetical protein